MNCNELVDLITEYLENALPPREAGRFEAHLEECDHCRRYLEQMRLSVRATGQLNPGSLSEEAVEDLLRVFADWRR